MDSQPLLYLQSYTGFVFSLFWHTVADKGNLYIHSKFHTVSYYIVLPVNVCFCCAMFSLSVLSQDADWQHLIFVSNGMQQLQQS